MDSQTLEMAAEENTTWNAEHLFIITILSYSWDHLQLHLFFISVQIIV